LRAAPLIVGALLTTTVPPAGAADAAPPRVAQDWPASPWGADDRVGAANNLSPEGVLRAADLVRTGRVYSLGQVVSGESDRGQRSYNVVVIQPGFGDGQPMFDNGLTVNDDLVIAWQGLGTRIDGLAHVGIAHRHYNGVHARDFVRRDGLLAFGVESIPPIVTRGVLLDLAALHGVEHLPVGTPIHDRDLQAAEKRQGLRIERGDVVLLHTGWQPHRPRERSRTLDAPGLSVSGARYLASKGVVMVGADTEALDVVPAEREGEYMPVHQELLVKSGVYILQDVVTGELARDRAYVFMFVLGQPKLKGAVTAIVNPIAIR
jgi:kynurenine formamidase